MYVRGGVDFAGRQTSVWSPAESVAVVDQTVASAGRPIRIVSVRTASMRTRAGLVRRKRTIARSRNPSPFGETVVRSRWSPANGVDPFATARRTSAGGGCAGALV